MTRSLDLTTLGVRIELSADPELIGEINRLCSELIEGDGVPATEQAVLEVADGQPFAGALAELTELAVSRSPLLCIHAGVVLGHAGVLAFPGRSGLGKSTLTAALVRAGFGYLSDEALAVQRRTGRVARFARPLGLAPDVWGLLGIGSAGAADGPDERHFRPDTFGPVPPIAAWPDQAPVVSDILLVERADSAVELHRIGTEQAVAQLLRRSFNHYRDPASSFATAVSVARQARVWTARYRDAVTFAEHLAAEFGTSAR